MLLGATGKLVNGLLGGSPSLFVVCANGEACELLQDERLCFISACYFYLAGLLAFSLFGLPHIACLSLRGIFRFFAGEKHGETSNLCCSGYRAYS